MRKIISLLIILVMTFCFIGCDGDDEKTNNKNETVQSNQLPSKPQTNPEPTQPQTNPQQQTIPTAFNKVISYYQKALADSSNPDSEATISDYYEDSVKNIASYGALQEMFYAYPKTPYYAITDVNKDGVPELAIGAGKSVDNITIYDFFAFEGETPIRLFSDKLGRSYELIIYDNGIFRQREHGISASLFEFFELPANSTSVKLIVTYDQRVGYNKWTRTDGNSDVEVPITQEEYYAGIKQYETQEFKIDWVEITVNN